MARTMIETARLLARVAHAGQVDKSGAEYLGHPARVARRARAAAAPERADDVEIVGWLHDVVEDTSVTLDGLRRLGMSDDVVAAVDAMTRRDGEAPDDYYRRVADDPIAVVVKVADLDDNTDEARLAALDDATRERLRAKYRHARSALSELVARSAAGGAAESAVAAS